MKLKHLVIILTIAALYSCDNSRLFEKNTDFNDKIWQADSVATFNFTIEDIDKAYNIYLNLRNTNTYPYYNLYVKYTLEDSLGTVLEDTLVNHDLFEEKSGKPYGSGLGDIFSHQFVLQKKYAFEHEGTYQVKLQQYMRQDSLRGVVSAGLRVEDALKE